MKRLMMGTVIASVLLAATAASAARRDRTPPAVRFTTPDGAVLVAAPAGPTELTTVSGTASDRSGIRSVRVFACTGSTLPGGGWTCGQMLVVGSFQWHTASRSCVRTTCAWSARLDMLRSGHYLIFATATDAAGNKRHAGPIEAIVL